MQKITVVRGKLAAVRLKMGDHLRTTNTTKSQVPSNNECGRTYNKKTIFIKLVVCLFVMINLRNGWTDFKGTYLKQIANVIRNNLGYFYFRKIMENYSPRNYYTK